MKWALRGHVGRMVGYLPLSEVHQQFDDHRDLAWGPGSEGGEEVCLGSSVSQAKV